MDQGAESERRGVGWLVLRGGALCLSLGIVATLMVRSSAGCSGPEPATREAEAPGSAAVARRSGAEEAPASTTSPTQAPAASSSGKREYGSTGKSWADPNLIDRVLPAPSVSQSAQPEPEPAFIPGTKSGVMIDRGRSP